MPSAIHLCKTCQEIFTDGSYDWWRSYHEIHIWPEHERIPPGNAQFYPSRHHQTFDAFIGAVDQGCWLCVRLQHSWQETLDAQNFEGLRFRLSWSPENEGFYNFLKPGYFLLFTNGWSEDKPDDGKLFYIEEIQSWNHLHDLAESSKSQTWTGHDNLADLGKGWLKQCLDQHVSCARLSAPEWHPTRLLDISCEIIYLRHTIDDRIKEPYATLSHCWGDDPFWVLTKETLPQMCRGVPRHEFPQTFQDAIATVRRLDIKYLWIDSYTIIQGDDPQAIADWDYEAGRMEQVYSNSVINIGAANASGPSEGLFSTRGPHHSATHVVRWRPASGEGKMPYSIRKLDQDPLQAAFRNLSESPLMRRGWVVQECVLSPRMLTFTGSELFWQCSEAAACEAYPDREVWQVNWASGHLFWLLADAQDLLRANLASQPRFKSQRAVAVTPFKGTHQERWGLMVAKYSRALLKYPQKDRFKALEGVGKHAARLNKDVYKHGLLGSDLLQALSWDGFPMNLATRSKPRARVPSWHWASREEGVSNLVILDIPLRGNGVFSSPIAYPFMSDDCKPLASGLAKDFYPNLLCVGRLITVHIHGRPKYDPGFRYEIWSTHRKSAEFSVQVILNDEIDTDAHGARYAILPLKSTHQTRPVSWSVQEDAMSRKYRCRTIGLFLRCAGDGTFNRLGRFWSSRISEDIRTARPQIVVLS